MDPIVPILTILIPAALGALWMMIRFGRLRRPAALGAGLGALAGGLGALSFMAPLNFCTFEPETKTADVVLGIILVAVGTILLLSLADWIMRLTFSGNWRGFLLAGQASAGAFRTSWFIPLLLLAPTLLILLIFLYYPAVDTFRLATLLAQLGNPRTVPVCVSNFTRLIVTTRGALNTEYLTVVWNTFFIAFWIVTIGLSLSLAIAYLAFQKVKGASIYRTLLIWPYAISPAVAGIIFFIMFDPVAGVINHIIEVFGGQGADWIKDPTLAPWTIIAASVWKTLGYNILFYIAGLQNVSTELVEAAAIDGANAWQRFRNVVIPSLSPITFFLIITNITYAFFDIFGTIDYLTKGGPAGRTSVMIYQIYETGIIEFDLGKAAAQSVVLFLMVIGITVMQFRTSGRRVSYGA